MRILHLTDLHIHGETPEAHRLWDLVPPSVSNQVFDYIIVSGDLSNSADPAEYSQVEEFLRLLRDRHVKDREVARIVVVPGNHDVQWGAGIGEALTAVQLASPDTARLYQEYGRQPEKSSYRFHFDGTQLRGVRLNPLQYHRRFAPFQALVRQLYGDPRPPHRWFNFASPQESDHWSAHVFPEDKLVIYGINSCTRNDEYLRGACLSEAALKMIRGHVKNQPADFLKLGVWHHGLATDRGFPDYLTLSDLANLRAAGLTMGIHGHTHEDQASDAWRFLRRHFPVVSTGSFAAVASERPGGVRNQLSLLDLDGFRLRWRLLAFDERRALWEERPADVFLLAEDVLSRQVEEPGPEVELNDRTVTLDEHGVARVDVHLTGVSVDGELVLATPLPGFNSIEEQPRTRAVCGGARMAGPEVRRDWAAGPLRFSLSVPQATAFDELRWSYQMSSGFALDSIDAVLGQPRAQRELELASDQDGYLYVVEALTRELRLTLRLPPSRKTMYDVEAVAQRRRQTSFQGGRWEDDPAEIARLAPRSPQGDEASLVVPRPRLGYRYGLKYRLAGGRKPLDPDVATLVERVSRECRESIGARAGGGALAEQLTAIMNLAIESGLGAVGPAPGFWIGHLWSDERRQLLPCFGQFPPEYWGATFPYGAGIAGHAFRTRSAAVYRKVERDYPGGASAGTRLLYRTPVPTTSRREYEWIIEVPLLVGDREAAVGVLGFAGLSGVEPESATDEALSTLAEEVMKDPATPRRVLLNRVAQTASHFFWQALAAHEHAAARVLRAHWPPPPDSPRAAAPG